MQELSEWEKALRRWWPTDGRADPDVGDALLDLRIKRWTQSVGQAEAYPFVEGCLLFWNNTPPHPCLSHQTPPPLLIEEVSAEDQGCPNVRAPNRVFASLPLDAAGIGDGLCTGGSSR